MSEERIWLLVCSLCVVGAGLAAVFGGVGMWRSNARKRRTWRRAQGRVVDSHQRLRSGSHMYSAIVEFEDHHGVRQRMLDPAESSGQPRTGKRMTVLYDPADPEDAEIHTVFRSWAIPVLVSAFGMALTAAGAALLLRG